MTIRPKIIIIGAGFGGLTIARSLVDQPVDILLVDRNNYHTFVPLLYQVATAALDPSEIAYPIRGIFRGGSNVRFLLGTVTAIDTDNHSVTVRADDETLVEQYDELVVATGSTPAYFGNTDFREHSFELRTLADSLRLRNHILSLFEQAVWEEDKQIQDELLTIMVVGGGPTGIETAGAVYELYNHVLTTDYTHAELHARVLLVEMQPHLLSPYPERLRKSAKRQLESLGVEVLLEEAVSHVAEDHIVLKSGTRIPTHTLIWAAGVQASPVAKMLNVELTRGGRVPINETIAVRGLDHVYAIGDVAYLEDAEGNPYPQLIPIAQQQAKVLANNLLVQLAGIGSEKRFSYFDKGTMATIGRSRAVAWIFNRFALTGRLAWFAWLGLHLVMLMGFRNRLNVFVNWVWNYLTYDRSVRIILPRQSQDEDG